MDQAALASSAFSSAKAWSSHGVSATRSDVSTVDTANVEALVPWLDHAFAAEKAALAKAAA